MMNHIQITAQAVAEAIAIERNRTRDKITTEELFDLLLSRINFDGMDPDTFTIGELRKAIPEGRLRTSNRSAI